MQASSDLCLPITRYVDTSCLQYVARVQSAEYMHAMCHYVRIAWLCDTCRTYPCSQKLVKYVCIFRNTYSWQTEMIYILHIRKSVLFFFSYLGSFDGSHIPS